MQTARLLTVFLFIFFINNLLAQPFEKDTSFGEDGEMILSQTGSMLITADDKIVLLGLKENEIRLERMTADGVYDTEFGTNGVTTLSFEEPIRIYKRTVQPDGKILLVGSLEDSLGQWQALIVRLQENGHVDISFGEAGIATSDFIASNTRIMDVAVQENGQLVLVGNQYLRREDGFSLPSECMILRFNENGRIDKTFGNEGIVLTNFNTRGGSFSEVAITADGKIIAAGDFENRLREQDFGLAKYTSEGILDTIFGDGGKITLNFNLADDFLAFMTLLENGKILVGGTAFNRIKEDIAFAQFTSDGQLDTTFGEGGIVLTDLSGNTSQVLQSSDRPTSYLRRLDGRILLCGNMHTRKDIYDYKSFLVQYMEDGQLDQGFGNGGKLILGAYDTLAIYDLANQSDGKIMATGSRIPDMDRIGFITRFLPDLNVGTIDFTSKGNNALVYPNPIQTEATLEYTLEYAETLTLQLTDLNGRILKTYLQNEQQKAGVYQQEIDLPINCPKGVYVIRLSTKNGQLTIKVVK